MKIVAFQTPDGIKYAIKKGWLFPRYKCFYGAVSNILYSDFGFNSKWRSKRDPNFFYCLSSKYQFVEATFKKLQGSWYRDYKEIKVTDLEKIIKGADEWADLKLTKNVKIKL